jgi:hypothetical protein
MLTSAGSRVLQTLLALSSQIASHEPDAWKALYRRRADPVAGSRTAIQPVDVRALSQAVAFEGLKDDGSHSG